MTSVACEPNAVKVGDEVASGSSSVYLTRYDNPEYRAHVIIAASADGHAYEEASRVGRVWGYQHFVLRASQTGGGSGGSEPDHSLAVRPSVDGTWDGSTATSFEWQIRGTQLGYTPMTLGALKVDATNEQTSAAQSKTYARDPEVFLVPLQLVRVFAPPADPLGVNSFLGSFTPEDYKWVVDKVPVLDVAQIIRHPGGELASAQFKERETLFEQAYWKLDEIFYPCGIQFREISTSDYTAPPEHPEWITPPLRDCNHRAVKDLAFDIPHEPGLPFVFFPYATLGEDCPDVGLGVSSPGEWSAIALNYVTSAPLTLAHELGHLVGLDDDHDCQTDHLMCAYENQQTAMILPQDCTKARQYLGGRRAGWFRFWGVEAPRP